MVYWHPLQDFLMPSYIYRIPADRNMQIAGVSYHCRNHFGRYTDEQRCWNTEGMYSRHPAFLTMVTNSLILLGITIYWQRVLLAESTFIDTAVSVLPGATVYETGKAKAEKKEAA